MVHVVLVATGDDAERWRGWLSDAGVRVTPCADLAAVASLAPRPSVVVVDAATGVAVSGEVPDAVKDVPVIALADEPGPRATEPGRAVALPRSASRAALVGAVLALSAGLRVEGRLTGALGNASGASGQGAPPNPHGDDGDEWLSERPTARERDVIALAALGLTNRAIAIRLGLSNHTVKFHLASIYGKLGARTRTQAVRRAIRRGWIAI